MSRRHHRIVGALAVALGMLAPSACGDETTGTSGADIGVDAPGPCPGGAPDNACGGCEPLSADVGAPGSLCTTAEGLEGVSTCDGADAVVCAPLAHNGCGGTATLEGTAGSPCGACGRGVWTCETPDAVSCVGGDAGVNACGGCRRLEAAPASSCGACGGTWQCAADGESVACLGDTQNVCGGCAALAEPGPGALCNGNGTVTCDGADATFCAPPGGNACGGSTPLELVPGDRCGPCDDGLAVCATPEATVCIGASAINACGGCGFLADSPGTACAPTGVWTCDDDQALGCAFSGGNGCGGLGALVNPDEPGAEVVLGAPCGTCDAGKLACLDWETVHCVHGADEDSWVWPDEDEDGYGDASATPVVDCDPGPKTTDRGGDCDDSAASANPGPDAVEVCDGLDNDCDGQTDEGTAGVACTSDSGCGGLTVCEGAAGLRCDAVAAATEACDGVDNDCDGDVDEPDADGCVTLYPDADGDGFGVTDEAACVCPGDAGYAPEGGDCDDTRADVSPEAFELCNAVDDDCDGTTDVAAADAQLWYPDVDEDTFGDPSGAALVCDPPAGWVDNGLDCDDAAPQVHPSTPERPVDEICDGLDNDCDGATDPDVAIGVRAWLPDYDDDTFGAGSPFLVQCAAPAGYVEHVRGVGIAAGPTHGVAVGALGELVAWGAANGSGEAVLSTGRIGVEFTSGSLAVAAGAGFTLAVDVGGGVRTWGIAAAPSEVEAVGALMVAAGDGHALALLSDGTVAAWGANTEGQTDVVAGLVDVVSVAAGGGHSLAARADGTVAAWGRNVESQTDVPAGLAGVRAVAAGGAHSVALLNDGTLVAWGLDSDGQATVPAGLEPVAAVAAGAAHTVALLEDGTVVAFGSDADGQSSVPNGLSDVVAVAAGDAFSAALRGDGTVWVWGDGADGQATVPKPLKLDCDNTDPLIHPDADDVCDFVDNDCDGALDMDDSQGTTPWYADGDGDLHGDPGAMVLGCAEATPTAAPAHFVTAPADDCDDVNPETYLGAPELVGDGIDQSCDQREYCYVDGDGDGAAGTFEVVMESEPGDLLCAGTSVTRVRPTAGVIAETTLTLGTSGLVDCDDDDPSVLYSCTCLPNCDGKMCGDDGCGGSCGSCDDGEPCTDDACDFGANTCDYTAVVCDDGVACTSDACEPGVGCVFTLVGPDTDGDGLGDDCDDDDDGDGVLDVDDQCPLAAWGPACVATGPARPAVVCAATGITLQAPFDAQRTCLDLGGMPGGPTYHAGLVFSRDDPDVVLIGGSLGPTGGLYAARIARDSACRILGFYDAVAERVAEAPHIDGGLDYGPGGVLFLSRWPLAQLGQLLPGSATTDKVIDLAALGVAGSPGGVGFVPPGFASAGALKLLSFDTGQWYTVELVADGAGTWDATSAKLELGVTSEPEGFAFVKGGVYPAFAVDSVMVAEWGAHEVAVYDLDAGANPQPATRRQLMTGLPAPMGAAVDPVSGDFLFTGEAGVVLIRHEFDGCP